MSEHGDRLLDIAMLVADGAKVDWADAAAHTRSVDERYEIEALEALARLSAVHRASPPPRMAPLAQLPCTWGPLEVIATIGTGTFGTVYQARDPRLERDVALKILHTGPDGAYSAPEHEARLLARVSHPNVVSVYGVETINGQTGLWMERLHGETLAARIRSRGPLPEVQAIELGVQVCRALGAVHGAGLLHRDVKAQNVMCDVSGRFVLTDFGTGLVTSDAESVALAGTPLYLAPEVLAGAPPTVASEIYSVGVLLFYAVSGRFPVMGSSLPALREAHASHDVLQLSTCRPDLSFRFTSAVQRALSADPSARHRDSHSLEAALSVAAGRRTGRRMVTVAAVLLLGIGGAVAGLGPGTSAVPEASYARFVPPGRYGWDVTSRSPTARRLYREAQEVFFTSMPAAERRIREAVAEDPGFASGHVLLAWTIRNQGGDEGEVLQHAATARQLSAALPDVERLFIVGSDHELRREWKPAVAAYERLLRLDPDHYWALLNLTNASRQLDDDGRLLLDLWTARARRYPNDLWTLHGAARALALHGDWALAARYMQVCRRLAPGVNDWWTLGEAYEAWMRDRPDQMRLVLDRMDRQAVVGRDRSYLASALGAAYMDLGQFAKARALFEDRPLDEWGPYQHLALVAAARHDGDTARDLMRRHAASGAVTFPVVWHLYFDLGLNLEATALLEHEEQAKYWDERLLDLLRAERLVVDGRRSEARPLLTAAIERWRQRPVHPPDVAHAGAWMLRASMLLARIEAAEGHLERAIDVLEDGSQDRARACFYYQADGYMWIELRAALARLYIEAGRERDAAVVADQVRRLLVFADDDHPLKSFDPRAPLPLVRPVR